MPRRYLKRNPSNYLSISDISNIVGMHPNTVRGWIRDDLLPFTTGLKNEYLVRKRDLQKFFKRYYDEDIDVD